MLNLYKILSLEKLVITVTLLGVPVIDLDKNGLLYLLKPSLLPVEISPFEELLWIHLTLRKKSEFKACVSNRSREGGSKLWRPVVIQGASLG